MRTTGPVAFTAFMFTALVALPGAADAAYYFESNMRTESDGNTELVRVRGYVDGDKAKVETIEGVAMPFLEPGSYLLAPGGGPTVYVVNPKDMTYSEMNLDQLFALIGSVLNATSGLLEMSFTDLANEKLGEEPGGEVLGYDTTRYEFRTAYTLNIGVLVMRRSMRVESHEELWCTDDIDADGFRVWLSPGRFRTGNAELDEMIKSQYRELDCVPLRSRVTTKMDNGGRRGGQTEGLSVTEVTVLREEPNVPAGTFDLPSGYTAVELLPDTSGLPPFGAAEEAEESAAEPEEGGRRRGLGGLRDLIRGR